MNHDSTTELDSHNPKCFAPFTQMLLQPTGRVSPCCYHFGIQLGDLRRSSMEDIWNGAPMQKLRREFLSNQIRQCKSRMHNLNCHRNFDRFADRVQKSVVQTRPPIRLDLRLNGQCNLSCIMCDVWQQPNGTYDESDFWEVGPTSIFPYLSEIELLGGEPFIQADTYRLIKEVTVVNSTCRWSFVTNGHFSSHKRILAALSPLKIRQLQVSVDSLNPDTYREIRRGGDLSRVLSSVEIFANLRQERFDQGDGFDFVLSQCVLNQNWREIPEFLRFCRSWSARPDLQLAFYDPSGRSSLFQRSRDDREAIFRDVVAAVDPADKGIVERVLAPILGPTH